MCVVISWRDRTSASCVSTDRLFATLISYLMTSLFSSVSHSRFLSLLSSSVFYQWRGVKVVDTTCPWVSKVWNAVDNHRKAGQTRYAHTPTHPHLKLHINTCPHSHVRVHMHEYLHVTLFLHIHVHLHIHARLLIHVYVHSYLHCIDCAAWRHILNTVQPNY
jgi:hypothetical protein